ncbi:MAG: DUF1592 domain-containing protein [Myxococcales bacterium]|nr:DUF1592 domain-containing protein [Myxococcales bacterium]
MACALISVLGCQGQIADPARPPAAPTDPGVHCEDPTTATSPLRHITRTEYDFIVRDLFDLELRPSESLAPDDVTTGYEVGSLVSPLLAEQYLYAAEAVGAAVDLDALGECDPAARGEEVCARELLTPLARRAYRHDLTVEETAAIIRAFARGRAFGGYRAGLRHALASMLVSPQFLYHVELNPSDAEPGSVHGLTSFELAARLSFFVWRSVPDEELLDAAASGALDTPEGLSAQAQRLLEDARSSRGLHDFHRQWLGLDAFATLERDPAYYPGFTAAHAAELRASLEAYIDEVMRTDATVEGLLTSTFAMVSAPIAPLFGVEPPTEEGFHRVELDPDQRTGLLTHPALLTLLGKPNQSDPIHRGIFVRTKLLCQPLPTPPNDIIPVVPEPMAGQTTRERFDQHRSDPVCAGCHRLIDPVGFGFEHYDAIGRWRETDDDRPIDASGEIVDAADASGEFDGAVEMALQLGSSGIVRDCVATQWTRFALNRIEARQDACTTEDVRRRFAESGGDFRELLLAIVESPSFRHRQVPSERPTR